MNSNKPIPLRLLPNRPLPPYSYVTGKSPHPVRDPQGHSHSAQALQITDVNIREWRTCEPYLWGIDLFNNGYYWEAHETWEAVWHAAQRRGIVADFCKALIKLAAAGVKAREGRPNGVQRHAQRAKQLFASVAEHLGPQNSSFMGLPLNSLIQSAQRLIDEPAGIIDSSDVPVVVVMPFALHTTGESSAHQ